MRLLVCFVGASLLPTLVAGQGSERALAPFGRENVPGAVPYNITMFPRSGVMASDYGPAPRSVHVGSYSFQQESVASRPSRIKGAAIGLGIGFVVGAAAFTAGRCTRFKDPLSGTCTPVGTSVAIGGVVGGTVGAAIGALIAPLWGSSRPAAADSAN